MRRALRSAWAALGVRTAAAERAALGLGPPHASRATDATSATDPGRSRRPSRTLALAAAAVAVAAVFGPAAPGSTRLAVRLVAAVEGVGRKAHPADPAVIGSSHPAPPTDAVGALFRITPGGQLTGGHFCTASVVDSPAGDLVMTAAHCVSGLRGGQFAFVPGFRGGAAPYGVWPVTRVIVDRAWATSADPDHDVAFLQVKKTGTDAAVQSVTGGERLGLGQPAGQLIRVTGYPDRLSVPITCENWVSAFSPTQLRFDCGGYADGTSGSPLLAGVNPETGLGTVIGVIGGYQQGGATESVSYAARLGASAAALYRVATARS